MSCIQECDKKLNSVAYVVASTRQRYHFDRVNVNNNVVLLDRSIH